MLQTSYRQEALSLAYVQTVAARCGMSTSKRDFDSGVDITLHEIVRTRGRFSESGFCIDIQVKSTIGARTLNDTIQYRLRVKNYNDLRIPDRPVPLILVLLALPEAETEWTSQDQEGLILRRCAYWTSLCGRDAAPNPDKVSIEIRRQNVFSPDALRRMMERIREGEDL